MRKSNIIIKPATMAYAKEFYGDQYTKSFKGHVALLNGKVVGIGGLSFENETMVLFSDIKEEMRPFKKDIVRSMRVLAKLVDSTNYPVVSIADKKEAGAEMLLNRLGFASSGHSNPDGSKIFWRFP